jgi:hypothetical protein
MGRTNAFIGQYLTHILTQLNTIDKQKRDNAKLENVNVFYHKNGILSREISVQKLGETMYKTADGRIATFNLSFEYWQRYFWADFDAVYGTTGGIRNISSIQRTLREAYDNAQLPDDAGLQEDVYCLQLAELELEHEQ